MTGFSVDPDHLHSVAARLDGLTGRADHLRAAAVDGQGSPTAAEFPETEAGRRAGRLWDDARPVFADGLTVATLMLARAAESFRLAASGYETTDTTIADSIRQTTL